MTQFKEIREPSTLLPILEKRLPHSCCVYNCAVMHDRFPAAITFYILGNERTDRAWIVGKLMREDYGTALTISSPPGEPVTSAVRHALSTAPFIDWSQPFLFIALEKRVSQIIFEICVNDHGKEIYVDPCILYFLSLDEGKNLKIRKNDDTVRIQPLDCAKGVQFIVNTWKYAKPRTSEYVKKLVEHNESGAVYVDGDPVAGVATVADGMCAMLYTLKPHRRKGYAAEALKYCMIGQAWNGIYPCLTVQCGNEPSVKFHDKIGMHAVGKVDWICYSGEGFD